MAMVSITALPRYEAYKDSGVEWLGDIPEPWDIKKIYHLFRIGRGRVISQQELVENGEYPVYSSQTKDDGVLGYIQTYDFDCEQITWTTDGANAGTVFHRSGKHNCTNVCGTLQPFKNSHVNLKYIAYALSDITRFYKRPDTNGAKIMNNEMAHVKVMVPPENEQTLIANFLDKKTAQIDDAIAIKEQQISLLKERKQIIIQKAVTQGLDPNVPMKDSGVDWIGEIPEHWDSLPGFTVFREGKDSNKGMIESRVLSLSYGNIIVKPEEKLVGLVPESFETYQLVLSGDIIIRCTDLQNDKKSLRTGIARDSGIITSAYLNLRLKSDHSAEFMHYFLHVLDITKAIYRFGSGLRQNLSYQDFKHMKILAPPKAEQFEIVNYINNQVEIIESSVDLIKKQIEKLKEYKTTLINSAVTGKIKITPEMVGLHKETQETVEVGL